MRVQELLLWHILLFRHTMRLASCSWLDVSEFSKSQEEEEEEVGSLKPYNTSKNIPREIST